MRSITFLSILLITLLFTACPGGGGSKNDTENETTTNNQSNKRDNTNATETSTDIPEGGKLIEEASIGDSTDHGTGDWHEPPIGTGRHSFYMDSHPALRVRPAGTVSEGTYKDWFRYELRGSRSNLKFIEYIAVLTEWGSNGKGKVTFEKFQFKKTDNAELLIWLGPKGGGPPTEDSPDLVYRRKPSEAVIELLSKNELGTVIQNEKNSFRTNRHKLESGSPNSAVKWEIHSGSNQDEPWKSGEKSDLYHFYLHFGH
ncbi:MAG: hypothetical protein HKN33_04230 [Pyrinomonadaceae bacterium]|nr:hypothetical protein [Pyrinomonadaceae bacterium]